MTPDRYLGQVFLENYTLDILGSFILCLYIYLLFFFVWIVVHEAGVGVN